MHMGNRGGCLSLVPLGLILAHFPVDSHSFAFKWMLMDLRNRIEKESKKREEMVHAQAIWKGGSHGHLSLALHGLVVACFPVDSHSFGFKCCSWI